MNFCEIFNNIFFDRTPSVAAYDVLKSCKSSIGIVLVLILVLVKKYFSLLYWPWISILKEDFGPFIEKKYVFNTCRTIENNLAMKQQSRADFRMTPDVFFVIVILVKNRLE